MAKKPSKSELAARQKVKDLRNPITGQQPNSFTQVTNRTLPAPKNVRVTPRDPGLQRRTRKAADEHLREGGDAPIGYRLDGIDPKYRTFVTGMNHMLPNAAAERGEPAINEPHEAHPGVTVRRRAEDLSGKEVRKGTNALVQYGHDPKDPLESVRNVQRRALDHVAAQHIAAGVNESSSQMFYGGHITTSAMDHDLESLDTHEQGVMAAHNRLHQAARTLSDHPEFQKQTEHLSHRERQDAAFRLTAQATADTSPNTKWRDQKSDGTDAKYPWPNIQQAEAVTKTAVEGGGRVPFVSGRVQFHEMAKERVQDALDNKNYDVHQYGESPKTVPFRGALVDKDAADSFKVTDVHEASVVAPWLGTAKAHMHERLDADGERVGSKVPVYEDTPKAQRRGLTPLTTFIKKSNKEEDIGKTKEVPDWGLSRPEAMLAEGKGAVHALNDLATRQVLTERGLSRGVNYADNVHSAQAATWGMQQMKREDVNVSPAHQYPVTRQWHEEGINVPANGDIRNTATKTNLSPQFGPNTRRGRSQSIWPEDH